MLKDYAKRSRMKVAHTDAECKELSMTRQSAPYGQNFTTSENQILVAPPFFTGLHSSENKWNIVFDASIRFKRESLDEAALPVPSRHLVGCRPLP